MELELRLDPDDAARLPRLKLLTPATPGRSLPQRIVWHDSPDAALTRLGLALASERGAWQLEKLVPDAPDAWSPGAPPPAVGQAAELPELRVALAELGVELPAPLAPVVAFTGRRHAYALDTPQGAVTLELVRGTLRAVTSEHQASRVHLSGDEQAVLHLGLAGELHLEVPTATLAGQALAAARATVPAPRRLGATTLPEDIGIAAAF